MYSASERTWSILALEIVPCTIFFLHSQKHSIAWLDVK